MIKSGIYFQNIIMKYLYLWGCLIFLQMIIFLFENVEKIFVNF